MDFSEAIAASDLKVSRSRHLIEFMKICEYWSTRSYLDLGPRLCTYKNSNWIFSETTVPIWTKFCMKAFRYKEMKIWWHDAGHMTKMATKPIYGKTWPRWPPHLYMVITGQKSSSPEPTGWFPRNRYVAFGTPAHHSLFKWWPWSDFDLFYGKVKFGNLGFSMGKKWHHHLVEYIADIWVLKVKVISWI